MQIKKVNVYGAELQSSRKRALTNGKISFWNDEFSAFHGILVNPTAHGKSIDVEYGISKLEFKLSKESYDFNTLINLIKGGQ